MEIAVSDQPVVRRAHLECGSFRDVAGHRFIRVAEQRLARLRLRAATALLLPDALQWVSIYRRASQRASVWTLLPDR